MYMAVATAPITHVTIMDPILNTRFNLGGLGVFRCKALFRSIKVHSDLDLRVGVLLVFFFFFVFLFWQERRFLTRYYKGAFDFSSNTFVTQKKKKKKKKKQPSYTIT